MNARWRCGFLIALLLAAGSAARASDDEVAVWRAARLLEEISSDPKPDIPRDELRQAVGILIVPRIVETRVGLGRKRGHGVFLSRDEKGEWGHPQPVEVSGVSAGAEVSHQVTDLIVLFRSRKAAEEYGKNSNRVAFYLGGSVSERHRDRFIKYQSASSDSKGYFAYYRHHGFTVGTGLSGERKKSPAFEPAPSPAAGDAKKPVATATVAAGKKAAEARPEARAAREAAADEARARRMGESPDMARLKATLTAMTTPPPDQVAATGTKDTNVRPAGGARVPATSAAPARSRPPDPSAVPPR